MTNRSMGFGIRITADGQAAVVEADKVKKSLGDIGRSAEQANRHVETSSKQAAFAMRQLPMQMTDVAVGLASGQSPFMVLMQQGGQLKDTFGGIGPALRAVGGYVAALINPFTLAAGAVGLLTAAYYQGSKEADAYTHALIMTGNMAGVTAGQLQDLANRAAKTTGATHSISAEALAGLVATGKVARENLELTATAAVAMQRATGTAIEDTVAQFEALGKSPVEASLKLNDQYNYLTADIYRQIKALEDQGRAADAAALAQRTYAEAMIERSGQIEKNLGVLESSWKGIADAAKKAWDAMLDIGRKDSLAEMLSAAESKAQRLRARISKMERGGAGGSLLADFMRNMLATAEGDLARLKALQSAEEERASATAERVKQEQAGVAWLREGDKFLTKRAQMDREILRTRNLGIAAGVSQVEIERRIAAIRQKYTDKPKTDKPQHYQPSVNDYQTRIGAEVGKLIEDSDVVRAAEHADKLEYLNKLFFELGLDANIYVSALDRLNKAKDNSAETTRRLAEEEREAQRLIGMTTQAKLADFAVQQDRAARLLIEGRISFEGYEEILNQLGGIKSAGKDTFDELTRAVEGWGKQASQAFVDFAFTGKGSVTDLVRHVLMEFAQMQMYEHLFKPLFGAAGSWLKDALPGFGGGRASGGPVYSGSYYRVNEQGPELLSVGGADYLMVGGNSGRVTPLGAGGITNHVSVAVSVESGRVQADGNTGAELGRRIEAAVRSVLVSEKRAGGLLAA